MRCGCRGWSRPATSMGVPARSCSSTSSHVTTAESISIYTYWHGGWSGRERCRPTATTTACCTGLTCSAQGARPLITEHDFYIKFGTHQWMRQDTVYEWQGPALKLFASRPARRIPGQPSPALVGVQCGHLPSAASASTATVTGVPVPAHTSPASVSFISASTGFVLGAAPCTHRPCTVILRTLDRGRSWRSVSAPAEAISAPDGEGLWGLRFAGARRGYGVRRRAVADQESGGPLAADEDARADGARVCGRAGP